MLPEDSPGAIFARPDAANAYYWNGHFYYTTYGSTPNVSYAYLQAAGKSVAGDLWIRDLCGMSSKLLNELAIENTHV